MRRELNRYTLPKLLLPCLLLCLGLGSEMQAQVAKYSNEFLQIGVGARSLGMAGSSVASTNDVTSGYWNPSGLTGIEDDYQFALMHSEYFAGIAKYDYGSFAMPISDGSRFVGVSLIRFGVDNIPNTILLFEPDGSINYNNISEFSVADYAVLLSYAQKLKIEGLSLGGSVKVIYRSAGDFASAFGFGLDLGLQYRRNGWLLGVQARDVTTTFNAWSFDFSPEEKEVLEQTGNIVPESSNELTAPKVIMGAGYRWNISDDFSLLSEVNVDLSTDGRRNVLISGDPISLDPHMGIELGYSDFIFLRAGVGNVQEAIPDEETETVWTVQPNLGVGIRIADFHIDYAYTNIGDRDQLLYSNVFSLKVDLNRRSRESN
jgi:hypothetical protein